MAISYTFKCIIVGPAAVGKSSLIRRFVQNYFSVDYKFTIGVDFMAKTLEYENEELVKLSIWDIGGQERFKFLRRSFYEGTHGAILVFDLSREQTFSKMKDWLKDMRNIIQEEIAMVILGNKSDLLAEVGEVINKKEVQQFAEKEGCVYYETSAKSGKNVEKAFIKLARIMVEKNS
jgi:small GTP-binding protein